MALEDLSMMRGVPDCAVFYPCDGVSTETAGRRDGAAPGHGVHAHVASEDAGHLRIDEKFPIGGSKVMRHSDNDVAMVIGAGVTVFEALKAYDNSRLKASRSASSMSTRVQPIDAQTMLDAAKATDGRIITVEDHYAAGGVGDAVTEAVAIGGFAVRRLAVREIPRSGQPDELLDRYGISARHIVDAVRAVQSSVRLQVDHA